jgi:hypothetical protein
MFRSRRAARGSVAGARTALLRREDKIAATPQNLRPPLTFENLFAANLIPFPYQNDVRMYGNDVMDFTIFGLRSM